MEIVMQRTAAHPNPSGSRARTLAGALSVAVAMLVQGCSSGLPATRSSGEGRTLDAPSSLVRVVPVRGTFVARDGAIEARLEPFRPPAGVSPVSLELYVKD